MITDNKSKEEELREFSTRLDLLFNMASKNVDKLSVIDVALYRRKLDEARSYIENRFRNLLK